MGKINWGAPPEEFPLGLFDDFDGVLKMFEYDAGDYGAQIVMRVEPADYELSARETVLDDDIEKWPGGWYGLGGGEDTYDISDDGMELEGPQPNRQTRGVKLILAIREHVKNLRLRGGSLKPIQGAAMHFKIVAEQSFNPTTRETREITRLYPSGPTLGYPAISGGQDESTTTKRRSRRAATTTKEEVVPPEANAEAESSDNGASETPAPTTGRRGRRGKSTTAAPEENGAEPELTLEDVTPLILRVIGEGGEDGVERRIYQTKVAELEEEYSSALVVHAVRKSTIEAALTAKIIEEEENILYLPQSPE